MSALEKLVCKIFSNSPVSYDDAEKILLHLDFVLKIRGSHHIFRKTNFAYNISLKRRKELHQYQINVLKQVLLDHGFKNKEK